LHADISSCDRRSFALAKAPGRKENTKAPFGISSFQHFLGAKSAAGAPTGLFHDAFGRSFSDLREWYKLRLPALCRAPFGPFLSFVARPRAVGGPGVGVHSSVPLPGARPNKGLFAGSALHPALPSPRQQSVQTVVSVFLVVAYLRLVTGMEFAAREAG
jgi:hypothetical protein